ncbi:MAG: leucyl aminopeptidase, partial [Actinobacteria bacterium]|nr:leucyl aminopeptidase [Actinomycetota bacterium]
MEVIAVDADADLTDATLIAGVLEDLEPAPGSESAFASIDSAHLNSAGFEGKKGQTLKVPHDGAAALLLVGLGDEISFETVRAASGNAIRKAKTERVVTLLAHVGIDGATRAVVEGSALGGYQFRTYKTDDDDELDAKTVEVVGADEAELTAAAIAAEATNLARDWINTPAKDKAPEAYARRIEEMAVEAGIGVDVWDRTRIEEEELGAVLGVAAGSDRDPRVVTLSYSPEGAASHLALVGKGITFDSGGLSLKSAASMEEMKDDMSGS